MKERLWKFIKHRRWQRGFQAFSNLQVSSGVESLAARGSLPSVGRDCVRERLPTSANVHCKQNRAVFLNVQNISARRKCELCKPKPHSWFWTFKLMALTAFWNPTWLNCFHIFHILKTPLIFKLNGTKKAAKIFAGHKSYFLGMNFTIAGRVSCAEYSQCNTPWHTSAAGPGVGVSRLDLGGDATTTTPFFSPQLLTPKPSNSLLWFNI